MLLPDHSQSVGVRGDIYRGCRALSGDSPSLLFQRGSYQIGLIVLHTVMSGRRYLTRNHPVLLVWNGTLEGDLTERPHKAAELHARKVRAESPIPCL